MVQALARGLWKAIRLGGEREIIGRKALDRGLAGDVWTPKYAPPVAENLVRAEVLDCLFADRAIEIVILNLNETVKAT